MKSRQRRPETLLLATLRHCAIVLVPAVVFLVSIAAGYISFAETFRPQGLGIQDALCLWVLLSLATHYVVSVCGMLRFGCPQEQNTKNTACLRSEGWNQEKRLVFCFVSQGVQESVLKNSVAQAIRVARDRGIRYHVEVVVDTKIPQDSYFVDNNCSIVVVPPSFETPQGTRFKARALCYAAGKRAESRDDLSDSWILHCDEDTLITESTLAGIHKHLRRADSHKVCGAGEIKYNAPTSGKVGIFSFMDCHRTGEDIGRFRLQFAGYGAALFGAHGSFLLVPAELERQVDFDFGPSGSIAEDIYFALRLRELGIPCRWIEGYVREQSTRDPANFLRQRARWIYGLLNGCFDKTFSLRRRVVLLLYLAMWRTTIVSALFLTILTVATGESARVFALWGLSMLVVGTNSWVGALRNVQEDGSDNVLRRAVWLMLSVVLIPIVCLFETIAVVLGIVSRPQGFFVVEKALPESYAQRSVA